MERLVNAGWDLDGKRSVRFLDQFMDHEVATPVPSPEILAVHGAWQASRRRNADGRRRRSWRRRSPAIERIIVRSSQRPLQDRLIR